MPEQKSSPGKLIFLDIDGTLTEPGSNIPPASALDAVRRARAAGNLVFLCTGRNYAMMSPLLKYGFDGAVASAGGYVVWRDEVIFDCPMTEEQRVFTMKILKENGVYRTVECLDGSYTDEGFKDFLREHAREEGGSSELVRWREQIEKSLDIRPMEEYKGQPVYKLVVMSPSIDNLKAPETALREEFEFVVQDDTGVFVNCEIINRKFNKGQAVERVCRHLGIPVSDTIGFGDSMNDREMLDTVDLSICMANGSEKLKSLADEVCPPVSEDGLRRAFQKHGLI